MQSSIRGPFLGKASICEPILRSLPEWFGVEAAIRQYALDVDAQPTFLAFAGDQVVGFLTLKYHTAYAAEIYVMGIDPQYHRLGFGRALVERAELLLRQEGLEYLQVKTLGPSVDYEYYARTREFYAAMGFRPLEELKQIWDAQNPCWLMVKYLGLKNQ
jgi:ribosomal protein S18 acetylase RimI-like enzyme